MLLAQEYTRLGVSDIEVQASKRFYVGRESVLLVILWTRV